MNLSGPQQQFADGIIRGLSATDAYSAAYPNASRESARAHGARLLRNPEVKAEIDRMRTEAEKQAGSAILDLAEVHSFIARVVRCRIAREPEDSDLFVSIKRHRRGDDGGEIIEFKLPDKLAAISRWMDLKGEGSEASKNDHLAALLAEIRK